MTTIQPLGNNKYSYFYLKNILFTRKKKKIELVDKCIGEKVWILMKEEKEISGNLVGFDDFFSKKKKIIFIKVFSKLRLIFYFTTFFLKDMVIENATE
jgi:hypothetical protein